MAAEMVYVACPPPGLRVPMHEVRLSTGDSVVLYDTPVRRPTAPAHVPDPAGLPRLRASWTDPAGGTQLTYARPR